MTKHLFRPHLLNFGSEIMGTIRFSIMLMRYTRQVRDPFSGELVGVSIRKLNSFRNNSN